MIAGVTHLMLPHLSGVPHPPCKLALKLLLFAVLVDVAVVVA